MSGKISLIPTPIGNLEDITFRAVRYLQEADIIFCEDTRVSGKLLQHYQVSKPLKSLHAYNEHADISKIIEQCTQQNLHICYISDAGTPGISDPGYLLAKAAIEHNILLECLPGACAFVPALVISGLPIHEFKFMGFLPPKKGRKAKLELIAQEKCICILYESPHKINTLLKEISEICGPQTQISLSRELSKLFEETFRGAVQEIIEVIGERKLKGEMVVCINPNSKHDSK